MIDPIKCCAEINLHDPSLLPTLQCTLRCMGHKQKCITGIQTLPIGKLGGWKHTTAFHNLFHKTALNKTFERLHSIKPTPDAQTIKTILMLWKSVGNLATEEDSRPFGIRVTLECLQQARKLQRQTSSRNTTLRQGAITSAALFKKERKHTQLVSPTRRSQSYKGKSPTRYAKPNSTYWERWKD